MPAGLSPFGKAILTSFFFYYISYVTLPPIEHREEWYVLRFELCNFFSDRSSTGPHPLGLLAGTFFTFFFSLFVPLTGFFRVFRLILPFLRPAFGASAFGALPSSRSLGCFFLLVCSRCPGSRVFLRVRRWPSFSLFVCFFFFFFSPLLLCFASG